METYKCECGGIFEELVREWCGENEEKWKGGRWRCVDVCDKCGRKETYNLDGM